MKPAAPATQHSAKRICSQTLRLQAVSSAAIGNAFKVAGGQQDLVLTYRLPSGLILNGTINYVGVPVGVPGDYNGNNVVDAADYILWRNGGPLQNEVVTPGSTTPEDYTAWRARFGNTSGSGSSLGDGTSVPEPATMGTVLLLGILGLMHRRQ